MTDYKQFLSYVLTQILPVTGAITQQGNQWRMGRTVPGLDQLTGRSFNTATELVDAISDHYVKAANDGKISGISMDQARKSA